MRLFRTALVIGAGCSALAFSALPSSALAVPTVPAATAPASLNPVAEARNYAITLERQAVYDTPAYQAKLLTVGTHNALAAVRAQAHDPGRNMLETLCATGESACAGDVRLYDWGPKGYGLVEPVLFTARDGATLSGHVWATRSGTAARPGIVITPGSVQADEQLYWYAAQALAKDGYVVLTFDAQGQGQSDTLGAGKDLLEGVPAQTDGRPFYDGTEDALDFFLSTPSDPYEPVPSCSTGTSHADKQDARVRAGLDSAYNPFAGMLDPTEIGLAGHSYGASGVSYIAQWDPRVKAVVAWDNLSVPVASGSGGSGEKGCPADPASRSTPAITKPALGLSADYGLPPVPNLSVPDPSGKSAASLAYTRAGVDTGEIVIRGGSHFEFSFIPLAAFSASLRGADLTTWYTTAWFDKYLKHEPGADARLLTTRWQHDADEAAVDPGNDGNAFSFYYRSRLDLHLTGGVHFDCEDLRTGCAGMSAGDGWSGDYSYLAVDTTADRS